MMDEVVVSNAVHAVNEQLSQTGENENPLQVPHFDLFKSIWYCFETNQIRNVAESNQYSFVTKGCKFAPDGSCLVVNTEDNFLRIYNTPQLLWEHTVPEDRKFEETVAIKEGGTVYDYQWYPHFDSWNPETACFATTMKQGPVHLWNADSSELKATYRIFDHIDELESAYSLAFSPLSDKLYCGTNGIIYVFDVSRPGRDCEKRDMRKSGFRGIISTLAVNPVMPSIYAAGSYLRTVSVNCEPEGIPLCIMEGHEGGVTCVAFHHGGHLLASGGRKDNIINVWDLRNPGRTYCSFDRIVNTHQKVQFQFFGDYLISGSTDGHVSYWDMTTGEKTQQKLSNDCVNGVSVNPQLPVIAVATGQRHFSLEDDEEENSQQDNSLKLFWCGK